MTRPADGRRVGPPCRRPTRRAVASAVLLLALVACTASPGPAPTSLPSTPVQPGSAPPTSDASPSPTTPPATTSIEPPPTTPPPPRGNPPNVLIILTDDQRFDTLGVMPKTRGAFLDHGTLFANAVATTPLCCPSRSTIMTGRFPHNTGVQGNGDAERLDQDTTLQRYLHDAGYQTGVIGKFLNDWPLEDTPPHFDHVALVDHGYVDRTWNLDGSLHTLPDYTTSFMADRAVQDLRAFARHPERPWY